MEFMAGDAVVLVSISGWTGRTARLSEVVSVDESNGDITIAKTHGAQGSGGMVFDSAGKWKMSGKVFDADYEILPLLQDDWKKVKAK